MSEIDEVVNGPMLRTHTARVVALLRHFKDQGRTLRECSDRRRLGMKIKTLQKYCRNAGLSFPDYTPLQQMKQRR